VLSCKGGKCNYFTKFRSLLDHLSCRFSTCKPAGSADIINTAQHNHCCCLSSHKNIVWFVSLSVSSRMILGTSRILFLRKLQRVTTWFISHCFIFCFKVQSSNVCVIIYYLAFVTDHVVAFPEKLLKISLLEAQFLAWSSPKTVWRPGSARTRWGSLSAPPEPLAAIRGPTSKRMGEEGEERGEGRKGKREGKGGRGGGRGREEGKGRKGKEGKGGGRGKGRRGGNVRFFVALTWQP